MAETEERVQIESREALRTWLTKHHERTEGVWLVTFKKQCGDKYVSWDEVVQEVLCFGWIDSQPRKLDGDRTMRWISPRQAGSGWSRRNKEHIEQLIAAGLLMPAGQALIEAAKADGSWNALDAIENLEIPPDLSDAFDAYDSARSNFEAFPRSVKRGILEWISTAKRPATRAKRVEETARLAEDNVRANQWRG